ncbi:facilitated trehalose transporter Tret1-like [Venturia canescens]|uniref:facilitated trehalose transporter Tret1-like n=1 Tax=Venturia canescens TaxID=32260 RepID=UPI001C9C0E3E|nr:facilitated trehalose transporter Tret1-like [Venturia canescens]
MTLAETITEPASNGTKLAPEKSNGYTCQLKPISRLRQSVPQICAVTAKNLLLITFGSTLGFPTILLPALQKKNPDVPVTMDDLTWISSINLFAVPLGCVVSGPVSQLIGRKKSMLIANIPFIGAWLLLHYATTSTMLFIPLALTGFTGGLIEGPVLTYVAEVTQPHLRGLLSATSTMSIILGIFTQLLAGSLADWRTIALINIVFPLLCATALMLVPESPYWLAGKGRVKEAMRALRFLRGWVGPAYVQEELQTIMMTIQEPSDRVNANDPKKEKFWKAYFRKSVLKPFLLITIAFFASAFGGSATLQTYAVSIFENMKSPIDKYTAAVWLGVAEFVGTLTCVLTIHTFGKRKLTFFSMTGTGLCFLFSAIYSYLLSYDLIDSQAWTWLPTTLLIGSAYLSHVGIRLLAWVLTGEVFPAMVRAGATGVAASVGYIFTSIANKTFLYMVKGMEFSGTFIFYAAMNLLSGIILYFMLPETEGRTLREIEEHYAGINNLKNKPSEKALSDKEKWAASNPTLVLDDTETRL